MTITPRFRSSGRSLAIPIIQPLDRHPQTGGLVKFARRDDADPPHLVAHTPEETDVLIKLEMAH